MGKSKVRPSFEPTKRYGYCTVTEGCKWKLPMPPGASTNSFTYNFKHDHEDEWKVFDDESKQSETPKPSKRQRLSEVNSKQPTMLNFCKLSILNVHFKIILAKFSKAEQYEDAIMLMICADADPISKVEKPGFVNLIKVIAPNFVLKLF